MYNKNKLCNFAYLQTKQWVVLDIIVLLLILLMVSTFCGLIQFIQIGSIFCMRCRILADEAFSIHRVLVLTNFFAALCRFISQTCCELIFLTTDCGNGTKAMHCRHNAKLIMVKTLNFFGSQMYFYDTLQQRIRQSNLAALGMLKRGAIP